MEKQTLKQFEGLKVKLILSNGFKYTNVIFHINKDNLLEFQDFSGEIVLIEPSFVAMVTKRGGLGYE